MENTKRKTGRDSNKTSVKQVGTDKNIPALTASRISSITLNSRLQSNKNAQWDKGVNPKQTTKRQTQPKKYVKVNSPASVVNWEVKQNKQQYQIPANLRVVLATLLDTGALETKMVTLLNKKIVYTIPALHHLITNYELKFGRAYTQQIRCYIISALWDQGLVEVGRADQWQQVVEQQLRSVVDYEMFNPIARIEAARDLIVNQKVQQLATKDPNMKSAGLIKPIELSSDLVIVFEQLEQQFYRQALSCQHLGFSIMGENNQSMQTNQYTVLHDKFCQFFEAIDKDKIGNLSLQMLINRFRIQGEDGLQSDGGRFIANKICNNIHIYDPHTKTVSAPNSIAMGLISQLLTGARVSIESFMELLNRVCFNKENGESEGLSTSVTYSAIQNIMTLYENIKRATIKQKQKEEGVYMKGRNQIVSVAAGIEHIRQAAKQIMQQGRIHGAQFKIEQEPVNYETFKRQPHLLDDGHATFRDKLIEQSKNQSSDMSKKQQINGNSQQTKNPRDPADFSSQQNKLKSPQTKQNETSAHLQLQSFMPQQSLKPTLQMETTDRHDPQSQSESKYWGRRSHQQQVKQFVAGPEIYTTPIDHKFNTINLGQHYCDSGQRDYDRLLRERIEIELQIVELERVKNRLKYYDILGK